MNIEPTWQLAVALVVLVAIAVAMSGVGGLRLGRSLLVAAVRALLQLAAVAGIVVAAIGHLWSAALFALAMFVIGVWTTTGRTGTRRAWPWVVVAMAAGVLPVLAVIFGLGVVPLNGAALIPLAGIITGNVMTAHTLTGRRLFDELRSNVPTYEAGLSIGLLRRDAIAEVTSPRIAEALYPALDQTRTVGLVTLPGAFIGVLLGGGTPLQAGAAQVLVLISVLCAQTITIVVAHLFVRQARLLPDDLTDRLRP
ncbi:ABC transporter permease [Aestuariimicrobium ganziense]|uniref:ABC transporter permease n=1 Tax=Aestuariimicrobium ganziense TaxID=2773677 RepID=UPI0019438FF7|nr:ABC transporter permease [Aestuariimicrobium ganziense]